jgi:hypothetical protein
VQTPLWVPLVVAGIGVLGTLAAGIAGVLITQSRSDKRDTKTWDRERKREQERWSREDRVRTFDHRREAYTDYFENIKAMARRAQQSTRSDPPTELHPDWFEPTFLSLNRLLVFGSAAVAEAAGAAYSACWSWGTRQGIGLNLAGEVIDSHYWEGTYNNLEAALLHAIRDDLQIPGGRLTVIP